MEEKKKKSPWVSYPNGNYTVRLNLATGTKIRFNDLPELIPSTIESMDLKITNRCTFKTPGGEVLPNCRFCHEGSGPMGKHGDIMNLRFLQNLGPWRELSIGGGNPLEHPDLVPFLQMCKERNLVANLTLNQAHFESNFEFVRDLYEKSLVRGVGVSLSRVSDSLVILLNQIPTSVLHVINGLIRENDLRALKDRGIKVLVLGYKRVRRGEALYEKEPEAIERGKRELYDLLPKIVEEGWFDVLSFDNLALDQLDVKRLLSEEEWNSYYMGDDGLLGKGDSASMYVDAVEGKFAKNSCAPLDERYPLMDTVEEMYRFLYRKEGNLSESK